MDLDQIDFSRLDLTRLTLDEKQELLDLLELKRSLKAQNRLRDYVPYPKQKEFHDAGALPGIVERLLRAGNQQGKTWSAGFESAMHLTGRYPAVWTGRRFDHPVRAWAASDTNQTTRDNPQRILVGEIGAWGTGAIPAECIVKIQRNSHGIADSIDYVQVRHESGGLSMIAFKSYEQGRAKFQGETLDFVWFDEEPDEEIYMEGKTRVQAGDEGRGGMVYLTFTPLLGMSKVVKRYLTDKAPGTHDTLMTIYDALHYTDERRKEIIASYPAYQRKARAFGVPLQGSGAVFPVEEHLIAIPPFKIPWHWPRIAGCDFGWEHPAAGAWIAWDRENDVVYVYDCYRQAEQSAIYHASYFTSKPDKWVPIAWPHDGLQHGKNDGVEQAEAYRRNGANMRDTNAKSETDGISLEASVGVMLERMQTGRLKVFNHLHDWFEEFRSYHRKDGQIVKEADDILCATRYAIMDLRYAITAAPERAAIVHDFEVMDDEAGY